MTKKTYDYTWEPLDIAAAELGYSLEGLRRRLRQLREQGHIVDTGRPPNSYIAKEKSKEAVVVLFWPNSKNVLIRSDAPRQLLVAKRGKRTQSQE
jgi:DNA-binding Lrp family transcriptional regulator